ncbi:respiratory chain complex I subunit 1 family protein [Falsiroseomonas selenitidurans]|uniref:Formate hydrogenlyase n=1 Tax=Falsiroseomonas selenitidurans TaxID=2716335 RepID=A0ABX1E610_9PROT|nr:NADH-quinone oxidoreductase subunit H [Falsiroseomonas selenitidurans]NKC32611.1 formate hydrogenlyase [Falsiroseomonas selenitidurans]
MGWLAALLTQILHLALVLAAAPLVVGGIRWLKARMMGRQGPHPLQPLRDLAKLLRKRPVLAETASWVSRAAPYLGAAAALAALALVPSFARGMAFAPLGDLVVIAGLLALGRVAMALAGLDAGTAFGGLGAAREMSFAAIAEPAFLLAVLSFAILAGTTGLEPIGALFQEGSLGLRVSLGLALVALLAVAVAENARIPVDNPATHLELTMVHEAMLLEASGRHLALWEAASALRLTLWLALLSAIFFPFGTAPAGFAPLGWLLGIGAWVGKMALLCLALAAFENAIAKMRVFRVPEFLGTALLLGLLGALLLFLSTRLA